MVYIPTSQSDPNAAGRYIDKAGRYHMCLRAFTDKSHEGKLEFEIEVLGGDHQDQVGRTASITCWLPKADDTPEQVTRNVNRIMYLAVALNLVTQQQWEEDAAAKRDSNISFGDAEGRQFMAELGLTDPNDKGQRYPRFQRTGCMGDDYFRDVAKCPRWIQALGGRLPTRDGGFVWAAGYEPGLSAASSALPPAPPEPANVAAGGNGDADDDLFA